MNKIEIVVLNEATNNPAGMQLFLGKLTQRGHEIQSAADLQNMYVDCMGKQRTSNAIKSMAAMPHGTIKRFSPIMIAIVGASRRFLAQARTNQVGLDYVSASLQYSDYSGRANFVVPYELAKADHEKPALQIIDHYLDSCENSMNAYQGLARHTDNDTAGYAAPQGLRNVLIMQGNHQSWEYFIRLRTCNRNTDETRFVALKIWEELLKTHDGEDLFAFAGADCVHGKCREGRMCCGRLLHSTSADEYMNANKCSLPTAILRTQFPLIYEKDM